MKTILLVDDKTENLYLLQSLLDNSGYKTIPARNGAEALGLMRQTIPDLIVTDILMPVMDGFTLCRECKKDKVLRNVPLVFYTATYTDSKDEEYAMNLGADRFILKPVEPDEFLGIIDSVIREVTSKKTIHKKRPEQQEEVILKEYNEVLIRKIEDKMVQTEKSEKELKKYAENLEKEIRGHRKSEDFNRLLFTSSPVGLVLSKMDQSLVDVNPAFARIIGRTIEECLKLSYRDITPDRYRKEDEEQIKILNRTGKYGIYEKEFVHNDGHLVPVLLQGLILERDNEQYLWSSVEDLTERKIAESALLESETKYRQLVTQSPDGIFIVDLTGKFTSVNKAICESLNYAEQELLNMRLLDIVPERYHELHSNRLKTIMKGESTSSSAEYEVIGKDGNSHFVEVLSVPYYTRNSIVGFQGIARDITERKKVETLLKESEEKYRRIFENVQDLYYETTVEGIILEVSPSIQSLSKANYRREDLLGRSMYEFYPNLDERNALLNQIKETGYVSDFEITLENRDGSKVPCSLTAKLFFDEGGKPSKIIGSVRDITIRKMFESQLIQAKVKAEESDRLKTAFLHNISHEIRTPLNAIVGFSALLSEPGVDDTNRTTFIDTINNSSNQLLEMINDIIEISNIEAGIFRLSREEVQVNRLLERLHNQFSLKANEKNISLVHKPLREETTIISDKTKIIQILSNLLSNAFKFTDRGKIEFGYTVVDDLLTFKVSDTGIGIPADQHDKIFDRFYQVEAGPSRIHEGTGLGLSISKAFVEMMGGKIWVESEPGKGSVFYFSLPFVKPGRKPSTKIPGTATVTFEKPVSILLAEDDENNFNLIRNYLAAPNINIIRAKTGSEAIKIVQSDYHFDIILMDIKMPDMDGCEATTRIKEVKPGIPVIAQTAYATDREKFMSCGCAEVITKPFLREELLTIMKKYL